MSSILPIKLNISEKLKRDKIYRRKFFRRRAHNEIAMSIKGLREKRQMRQVDLANGSNMKQSAISRIEQSEYSAWTLTTLFRVAEALDARVRIIIDPIEDVIEQYREKESEYEVKPDQYTLSVDTPANKITGHELPTSNSNSTPLTD